ncbi:MAG: spoIIIJ [Firmicutes bacterium]|nr:spoIIIJ [Bacillota bacterium]
MLAAFSFAPQWLVTPMTAVLAWFLSFTGSYGLSIILLTLALRVLILPLTIYQTKSMKRMQEVQPLMKEIQEKYKDQPDKLNKEMMGLYKSQGVNPFSGCLPMLIQMPFLYAIFAVVNNFKPEAHHASPIFIGINLMLPDPHFILPAITVIAMFAQSYLSGMGNDPNQKMMTYLMPLVFGYITFRMPAGVVLYWVVSTVFGLAQQAIYPGFPRLTGAQGPKGEAKRQ